MFLALPLPQHQLPPVPNGIVRSVCEELCDAVPSRTELGVFVDEQLILFEGPRVVSEGGVDVVLPPLSALSVVSGSHQSGYECPRACSMGQDEHFEFLIFLGRELEFD